MMKPAALLLADGTRFDGEGIGSDALALGEAVFYTGMTGYEEALTDPSYAGQLLTFTYPMIGNYGISGTASQHEGACVAGAVIKRLAKHPSHHAMISDLESWLREERVPTLVGIDTRALTGLLREHGTIRAALAVGSEMIDGMEAALGPYARETSTVGLVAGVATESVHSGSAPGGHGPHVVVIDCGVKRAILRELDALGARVTVVPYSSSRAEILACRPDAVVISPGPGDPADLPETIELLRSLVGALPLFGVCLGHQLLAIACGGSTYKLPFGHRGGNQPVKDLVHDTVLVTAHNHGYAVDGALPPELEATMINLNDGTNEGFRHKTLPIAAVQFHPEASPGPFDARYLFAEWLGALG